MSTPNARPRASFAPSEQLPDALSRLVETAPVLLSFTDPGGRLIYTNQAIVSLLGVPRERLLGLGWLDSVHSDDRARMADRWLGALENAEDLDEEVRVVTADGSVRWLDVHTRAHQDDDGKVVGHFGTALDITDRKLADARLQRLAETIYATPQEDRLRSLLATVVDAIGADNGFVSMLIDDATAQVVRSFDPEQFEEGLVYELETTPCANVVGGEMRIYPRDAQARFPDDPLLVEMDVHAYAGAPLSSADGTVIGVLAGLYRNPIDEPERVRPLLELAAAQIASELERLSSERELASYRDHLRDLVELRTEELSAANEELESFSYTVAHDLRSPLRIINGYAHSVREDCGDRLDDANHEALGRICDAATHMGSLIDAVLGLARVARAEIDRRTVDVTAMATELVEQAIAPTPDRKTSIRVHEGLTAEADPVLLREVLQNLIENAVKFSAERSCFELEIGQCGTEHGLALFVSDKGAGFNMTYADKLFAPFHRLHDPNDFPGTGVGLATAQRIVRRHRGRIWATGELGEGATFYFTLGSG